MTYSRQRTHKTTEALRVSEYSVFVIVIVSALTAVGKGSAASKGINNLQIKKRGFYPSMLDRLSILEVLF